MTHRQTDRQTDASDFIICPMLCHINGTDKKITKSETCQLQQKTVRKRWQTRCRCTLFNSKRGIQPLPEWLYHSQPILTKSSMLSRW